MLANLTLVKGYNENTFWKIVGGSDRERGDRQGVRIESRTKVDGLNETDGQLNERIKGPGKRKGVTVEMEWVHRWWMHMSVGWFPGKKRCGGKWTEKRQCGLLMGKGKMED